MRDGRQSETRVVSMRKLVPDGTISSKPGTATCSPRAPYPEFHALCRRPPVDISKTLLGTAGVVRGLMAYVFDTQPPLDKHPHCRSPLRNMPIIFANTPRAPPGLQPPEDQKPGAIAFPATHCPRGCETSESIECRKHEQCLDSRARQQNSHAERCDPSGGLEWQTDALRHGLPTVQAC